MGNLLFLGIPVATFVVYLLLSYFWKPPPKADSAFEYKAQLRKQELDEWEQQATDLAGSRYAAIQAGLVKPRRVPGIRDLNQGVPKEIKLYYSEGGWIR